MGISETTQSKQQINKFQQVFCKFKKRYPGALLFFRFGDFYEVFFDDAEICSQVCGLDLIEQEKNGELIPLVTTPFWLIDRHIKEILKAGIKVSLCEQVETTTRTGESVKHDVVRTMSPQCKSQTAEIGNPDVVRCVHRPQLRLVSLNESGEIVAVAGSGPQKKFER